MPHSPIRPAFLILAGVCILALSACYTAPKSARVVDNSTPIERFGVSFRPPAPGEWFIIDRTSPEVANIGFRQFLSHDDLARTPARSVVIEVCIDTNWNPGGDPRTSARVALERACARLLRVPGNSQHMREVSFSSDYAAFHAAESLRIRQVLEDGAALGGASHVEVHALIALHPQRAQTLIVVICSQRSRPGDPAPPIEPIGEAFLQNLQFTTPR